MFEWIFAILKWKFFFRNLLIYQLINNLLLVCSVSIFLFSICYITLYYSGWLSIYCKLCCNVHIVICNWHVQCYMCDWMDEQINQTVVSTVAIGHKNFLNTTALVWHETEAATRSYMCVSTTQCLMYSVSEKIFFSFSGFMQLLSEDAGKYKKSFSLSQYKD